MTNFPDWFFEPRRLDGGVVKAVENDAGGIDVLEWNGEDWVEAHGVDMPELMSARLAPPELLARLGVPPAP